MTVSGERQDINKWSNGRSCWTYFQSKKSKYEIKCKEVNKDNKSTHFTFYIMFVNYKREEAKIWLVQSWYNREQLTSLTYTHLILFDEVHIRKFSGPPSTSRVNKNNIRFPRYEEGTIDVKNGNYKTNNQPKKVSFKYEKEGIFCLGVTKFEIKEGTITGKRCLVFDYTEVNKVTIDAYQKEIQR